MTKKGKVLIFFLLLLLLLISYLILTSESPAKLDSLSRQTKDEKIALSEENYMARIKESFLSFKELSEADGLTAEKITELKSKILALKVPAKFKELHINFILALTKLENYLIREDDREKISSQEMSDQLQADYNWLNN